MTKTFKVTVEAKRGALISGSKISSKVWDSEQHFGDFRNVGVEEVIGSVKTEFVKPLYALGRKSGKGWKLIDFFNSEKRAENAVKKSVRNYKGCAMKGEFAVLSFCPSLLVWRVEGESVKA